MDRVATIDPTRLYGSRPPAASNTQGARQATERQAGTPHETPMQVMGVDVPILLGLFLITAALSMRSSPLYTLIVLGAVVTLTLAGVGAGTYIYTSAEGPEAERNALFVATLFSILTPTVAAMLNLLRTETVKHDVREVKEQAAAIANHTDELAAATDGKLTNLENRINGLSWQESPDAR